MDFNLTDEQELLVDSIKEFCERYFDEQKVKDMYAAGGVTDELVQAYLESGFGLMVIPEEQGDVPCDRVTLGLLTEEFPASALSDPAVLLPLAYLCIMATAVALLFQNVGQVWSDPASASVILSLESVFGVLFSVIFYGDPVTGRLLAGFALIFVAVVCSETKFSFLRRPAVAEAQDAKL